MTRLFRCIAALLLVVGIQAVVAAQESWPTYPLDGHEIDRGPGNYLSIIKLVMIWGVFVAWVMTTDWVNRDTQLLKLPTSIWNPANFFPFVIFFFAAGLSLPFLAGFPLLLLSWIAPLGAYVYVRNSNVEDHQKVLTPDHLRYCAAVAINKLGGNIDVEKKAAHQKGAPVDFTATSAANESKNQANMILARQSEGYPMTKNLFADAIDRRAERVMLDVDPEQVSVRYHIDGVWHEADPLELETGEAVLGVMKTLANAQVNERRKRQTGGYEIKYKDAKVKSTLVTQGTKTGERAILHMISSKIPFNSLTEAGMREKMQERLKELMARPSGIFLFSSVPSGGLSTTMMLTQKLCDRYLRDFVSFQEQGKPEPLADNIDLTTFDRSKPATDQLTSLIRKDPDVIIVNELTDKEVGEVMCNATRDGKMFLTSVRAKEAVEALLRVLLLKIPAKSFAPVVTGVLNQRLIRKLCEECKEEYTPSPDLLKKLGIPAGRVEVLYRPPTPDEDEPICEACGGLGYKGRTSIFELLVVDASLKEALQKQPKLEVLRQLARKGGNRSLQEEGVLLVAQGITSLPELSRVLKV